MKYRFEFRVPDDIRLPPLAKLIRVKLTGGTEIEGHVALCVSEHRLVSLFCDEVLAQSWKPIKTKGPPSDGKNPR